MAYSKVEIFGGQLDGAVLQNAASEAALRDLLAAVKKLDKSVSSNAANSSGSAANLAGSAAAGNAMSGNGILGKAMDGVANQIGNVIGATGAFAGMLITGETKLSKYTEVLNNQIIKELPLLGKGLGLLGDGVVYAIGVFEEWNDFLRTSSKIGASFNNSIIELRQAANSAYLDLDEMVSVLQKHGKNLPAFGGTVTSGAKLLSAYSENLLKEGGLARDTLIQMGYSTKDVNDALATYMSTTMKSGMRQMKSSDEVGKSFIAYQLHIDKLTKLTGKNAEQIEQEVAATKQDAAFQLKMNMLGEDERTKVDMALKEFTARYGDAGRQLFQSLFFGLAPQTDAAQNLAVQMPHLMGEMQKTLASAKSSAVSVKTFGKDLDDTMINTILNAAREAQSAEKFIAAMSAGTPGLGDLYSSITPILSQLANYGDLSKLTREQLRLMFKNAKDEQGNRDGITKTLNDFELAIKEMKKSFLDALLPGLKDLSESLKGQNLGEKFRNLGQDLGSLVTRYMPAAIKFFEYMGSDTGRQYYFNELKFFFKTMGVYLDYGFKRIFTPKFLEGVLGLDDPARDAELQRLKEEHETLQKELGITPLSAYVLPEPGKQPGTPPTGVATAEESRKIAEDLKKKGVNLSNTFGANAGKYGITSRPGMRTLDGETRYHHGEDVGVPVGTPIYADQKGILRFKNEGLGKGAGLYIEIENPETGLMSRFMHLDPKTAEIANALNGKEVKAGDPIGFTGNTGHSTGPHLHYELRYKGKTVNPADFYNRSNAGKFFGGTMSKGNLFQDFAKGTDAELHNVQAVMTPEQMNTMMNSSQPGAEFSDAVSVLNSNIQQLVSLTKQRMSINQRQLNSVEQLSGNLFA